MKMKRWLKTIFFIVLAVIAWNYPLKYRIGVNGVLFDKKIPAYAKLSGFLYRDWAYKDIVRDIIKDKKEDDVRKILDILRWVNENVNNPVPTNIKVMDDHPLNIIIRQYGTQDQVEDIFTILCSYAGMDAGMSKCYSHDRTRRIILSFVRVKDEWLIFEAKSSKHFLNKKGGIGSVGDYLKGEMVLSGEDKAIYAEFLDDLKNINFSDFTRAEEQMPLKRFPAKFRKLFQKRRFDMNEEERD